MEIMKIALRQNERAALQRLAHQRGLPPDELVRQLIIREIRESLEPSTWYYELQDSLCLGYLEIDRVGDLGPADECPDCGNPIGSPAYIAIYSDGYVAGPLCSLCASTQ